MCELAGTLRSRQIQDEALGGSVGGAVPGGSVDLGEHAVTCRPVDVVPGPVKRRASGLDLPDETVLLQAAQDLVPRATDGQAHAAHLLRQVRVRVLCQGQADSLEQRVVDPLLRNGDRRAHDSERPAAPARP